MAYWDATQNKILRQPTTRLADYPGWELVDCGCCNGLRWGGDHPRECVTCGGSGEIAHHTKSGVYAWYPGGPLCGRDPRAKAGEGR